MTLWKATQGLAGALARCSRELDKGYPEFDPSQQRDERGRWSGGGSRGYSLSNGRIRSSRALTHDDFKQLASRTRQRPKSYRRDANLILIQGTTPGQVVETRWEGKETTATAKPGDVLATNLGRGGKALRDSDGNLNQYILTREALERLYGDPGPVVEGLGQIWHRKGESLVEALHFPGGFDIVSPWGERQRAKRGYLLWNGKEVYGNHYGTFNATYAYVRSRKG